MRQPKISIIIPVYNGANYLAQAIESALNQTYPNVEIIVVNDGSTDNGASEKIAKSYGHKIRYFHKKNGGVASALNYGLSKATGDWFAWLSHDDLFTQDKAALEAHYIKKHPEAKVLFCSTGIINAEGKELRNRVYPTPRRIRGGEWYFKTWIYACSVLVHKSCFQGIKQPINESNRTTQDVEFTFWLLNHFELHNIPKVLVFRRDHQDSGVYQLQDINRQESERHFRAVLKKHGVGYLINNYSDQASSPKKAQAYNRLANYLLRGNPKISQDLWGQSLALWPAYANPATFLSRLGAHRVQQVKTTIIFVRNMIRGGKQRLAALINPKS